MAYARRNNHWQENPDHWQESQSGGDVNSWNELRGELEDLLDQVHMQSHDAQMRANTPFEPPEPDDFGAGYQRPFQPGAPATLDRRSHALASVQRAVDRFSEPEEAMIVPARSQQQLQKAIHQIRSSQRGPNRRPRPGSRGHMERGHMGTRGNMGGMPAQSPASYEQTNYGAPSSRSSARLPAHSTAQLKFQFDEIGNALESISARMEQFEQAIGSMQNSDNAVADMAMQIEQLSSVVEHLANNIGERGHIKRLENQIAKMADAIPTGADLDFHSLNERLDILSEAFDKLQDLQTQQMELSIKSSGEGGHMEAIDQGVRNINERLDSLGMDTIDLKPIEDCVRSVYDRIDALEQSMATPLPAIEKLSQEMADFTQAMRAEEGSNLSVELLSQVEGLVSRIEQIETQGAPVGELKIDMAELQSSVLAAVEPRFFALESKIGNLSQRSGSQGFAGGEAGPNSADTAALEEHIRLLAEKLDKTSSDLSGLQKVFSQQDDKAETPDIGAIADIVAQRTSQAMAKLQSKPGEGIEKKALDRLERRLSEMFADHKKQQNSQEFSQVHKTINQVNQRLERLEATLSAQAKAGADEERAAASHSTDSQPEDAGKPPSPAARRRAPPKRLRHPGLAQKSTASNPEEDNWEPSSHLLPELRDNMPRPPAQAGPLRAPVFDQDDTNKLSIPVPDSLRVEADDLEVRESEPPQSDTFGASKSSSMETGNDGRIKLPRFTDDNVTPPPPPASSFAEESQVAPHDSAENGQQNLTSTQNDPVGKPRMGARAGAGANTNPFEPAQMGGEPGNVSRSTFIEAARRAAQSKYAQMEQGEPKSIIARALARFQKKNPGDDQDKSSTDSENTASLKNTAAGHQGTYGGGITPVEQDEMELDDLTTVPESFISRHRQPILLAAAVVAVGFLTLNLINQRFSSENPQPALAVNEMESAIVPSGEGGEANTSPIETPQGIGTPQDTGTPAKGLNNGATKGADEPSQDVVGSIDRFSGIPGSPVRVIAPSTQDEMPARLDPVARIDTASLSVGTPGSSPLGLELPPEAIGPLLLRQTAANGDPRAQFEVGAIFGEGRAITQDLAAAAKWYERAAAQGFAPAGYRLANMLENGIGVEKDLASARLWYQLAADAGNRMSMHNLASLLASGQLGEQQFESAAHWFERAGSLGLTDSQFNLGMLYARGLGVPQSLENSFKWFSLAANAGDADAAKARDDIARSLDANIVAQLNNEILAWEPAQLNIRANFAPIGSWSDNFDPGPEIEAREVVEKVQAALNGIGFDAGTPDGLIGPKTVEAITGFETQAGMTPSGKVNPRLLAVLGSQPV
ncbi:MAG TPA: hypothetical protein ENK61_03985 [Devosia sp.]|nr:hypothetical protein [Devosia sp.]